MDGLGEMKGCEDSRERSMQVETKRSVRGRGMLCERRAGICKNSNKQ